MRLGRVHIDPFWLRMFIATLVPFLIVVIAKKAGLPASP
jgi:hypothetical protein